MQYKYVQFNTRITSLFVILCELTLVLLMLVSKNETENHLSKELILSLYHS